MRSYNQFELTYCLNNSSFKKHNRKIRYSCFSQFICYDKTFQENEITTMNYDDISKKYLLSEFISMPGDYFVQICINYIPDDQINQSTSFNYYVELSLQIDQSSSTTKKIAPIKQYIIGTFPHQSSSQCDYIQLKNNQKLSLLLTNYPNNNLEQLFTNKLSISILLTKIDIY